MVDLDQVDAWATALPEVTTGQRYGDRAWLAAGKVFARHRPFSQADRRRFGSEPVPDGDILALAVADLDEKQAIMAGHPAFFTIPHLDGHPLILLHLARVDEATVREALLDAWLAAVPPAVARRHFPDGV